MSEQDDKRQRIITLVSELMKNTVDNGCTPGEAAKFAAKAAELVERYQIDEAELRARSGSAPLSPDDIEVYQNFLRTGKRVFNPGMTQVINGLATGMCCKVILLYEDGEAVYGVIGDRTDADYVCQVATAVVPALRIMAAMEGAEHGRAKAALVRWTNQYLSGAGAEIYNRIVAERRERSATKIAQQNSTNTACTALVVVTGDSLAAIKRQAVDEMFRKEYPKTRTKYTRSEYDREAQECGREAGKRVGLHVGVEDNTVAPRLS